MISIIGVRRFVEVPFCKVPVAENSSDLVDILPMVTRAKWHLDGERNCYKKTEKGCSQHRGTCQGNGWGDPRGGSESVLLYSLVQSMKDQALILN